MGLSLEGFLAWQRVANIVVGCHAETVGGEWVQSCHQELGLIHASIHLLHLLIIVLPDKYFVAVDGIMVVIEGDSPGQQD